MKNRFINPSLIVVSFFAAIVMWGGITSVFAQTCEVDVAFEIKILDIGGAMPLVLEAEYRGYIELSDGELFLTDRDIDGVLAALAGNDSIIISSKISHRSFMSAANDVFARSYNYSADTAKGGIDFPLKVSNEWPDDYSADITAQRSFPLLA